MRTLLFLLLASFSTHLLAQDLSTRVGLGPEFLVNANDDELSQDEAALGLRMRASKPLNADVSAAADLGILAFMLSGQDDADYVLHPQLSLIVTLPGRSWAPYALAGIGGLFPIDGQVEGEVAFAVHVGYGWARLLSETSVYVEIDPVLVLREEATRLLLPIRAGVIF